MAQNNLLPANVQSFSRQTRIKGRAPFIAREILTMSGVNYELMPVVKMTAPERWQAKPVYGWPTGANLFRSLILLFGFIPIDIHCFGMTEASLTGFKESSTSILMEFWRHQRQIENWGENTLITDSVEFQTRIRLLGGLLAPVYRFVFSHRHKRLLQRYGSEKKDDEASCSASPYP
jgi:hypothetical protein